MLLTVTIRGLLNFNLFVSVFFAKANANAMLGREGWGLGWPHPTVWML